MKPVDPDFNPYAPPRQTPESPTHRVRQEQLLVERDVRTFAFMMGVSGTMLVVFGVTVVALALREGASPLWGLVGVGPGLPLVVLGRGLERFRGWSRWPSLLLALPMGLLFPIGTWVAFRVVSSLVSQEGGRLFSAEMARVRAATRDITAPIRSEFMWGLIVMMGVAVAFGCVGML